MRPNQITVHISINNSFTPSNEILIGNQFIKKWAIPTQKSIYMQFGTLQQIVQVSPHKRNDRLICHPSIAEQFGWHEGIKLCIKYDSRTNKLKFGPLIGVLLNHITPHDSDKPFGDMTAFCKELTDACQTLGAFVYIFSPSELRKNPMICGWKYTNGWTKAEFPLPQVLYNRLSTRRLENSAQVQSFIEYIKTQYKSSVFNEHLLNKTEVFRALKNEIPLLKYLPESHVCDKLIILKKMCEKYNSIFLKPEKGSLGKGIIRITRQISGTYLCHVTGINGVITKTYPSIGKLFASLKFKLNSQKYQIQQGIQLIEIQGRTVDFRSLVQKNRLNQWEISSIVARIAGERHFVSNLARGGTLSTVSVALKKSNIAHLPIDKLIAGLRFVTLEIAKAMEKNLTGHFGELGIDLAIDTNGRIWLIEVNSKPSKTENTSITPRKIRPSALKVIQYSRYLAGF